MFFVTRLKASALYAGVGTHRVPPQGLLVKSESIGVGAATKGPYAPHRVKVTDPETGDPPCYSRTALCSARPPSRPSIMTAAEY